MRRRWSWRVASALLMAGLVAGCASMPRSVRRQFADSFRCPYETILVEETGYRPAPDVREFSARGCGQEVLYNCYRIDLHHVSCSRTRY